MSYVLRVSKPGYDALYDRDENMSFSSELATHSIYNIVTLVKDIGKSEVFFTHNLGYTPKTWVFGVAGTAPDDYLFRVPTVTSTSIETDFYITKNSIACYGDSGEKIIFKVIVFTRDFNP